MGLAYQEWLIIAVIVAIQVAAAIWVAKDVRRNGISAAVLTLLFFVAPLAWVAAFVVSRGKTSKK